METNFKIVFKEFLIPYLGKRFIPYNAKKVQHPDGTELYLVESTEQDALDLFLMHIKNANSDVYNKYFEYLYNEYILDFQDENMFRLAFSDYSEWSNIVIGSN